MEVEGIMVGTRGWGEYRAGKGRESLINEHKELDRRKVLVLCCTVHAPKIMIKPCMFLRGKN